MNWLLGALAAVAGVYFWGWTGAEAEMIGLLLIIALNTDIL
jgi:hypothetical protein